MGHKHSKEQILAGALEAAFADGLSRLTYGRVAKRLGISDRVVVYYFATKDELISEVLMSMGAQLQQALAAAFTTTAANHRDLAVRAWPVLAHDDVDPIFGLFFEANGLAATGREPYRTLIARLVDAWVDWLAGFLEGSPDERRFEAEAALVLIDGLLLYRQLAGGAAAERAAVRLGVS